MVTPTPRQHPSAFRQRFASGEQLVGTFIKTPTATPSKFSAISDSISSSSTRSTRRSIASRSTPRCWPRAPRGTAGIVRVAAPAAANLLSALDCGAIGVLVPHVSSAAKAREIVAACRYRGGRRGYSGSPRAGRYGGSPMWATRRCIGRGDDRHCHDRGSRGARRDRRDRGGGRARRLLHRPRRSDGGVRRAVERRAAGAGRGRAHYGRRARRRQAGLRDGRRAPRRRSRSRSSAPALSSSRPTRASCAAPPARR